LGGQKSLQKSMLYQIRSLKNEDLNGKMNYKKVLLKAVNLSKTLLFFFIKPLKKQFKNRNSFPWHFVEPTAHVKCHVLFERLL